MKKVGVGTGEPVKKQSSRYNKNDLLKVKRRRKMLENVGGMQAVNMVDVTISPEGQKIIRGC
ncbi:hypothetical protein [Bacillus fonticola]|uniref:hypothetical protein n=1 Tax=Bacillus fonticola TaxID=2728853 RepID=UPI001D139A8F|nr:hypothetical protein [Bacillus fonticola]